MGNEAIAWILMGFACFAFFFDVIAMAVVSVAALPLSFVVVVCLIGALELREKS